MHRSRLVIEVLVGACFTLVPIAAGVQDQPIELTRSTSFSRAVVPTLAQELASKPFAPLHEVSPKLASIGYDQYHDIQYRPEARLWNGEERGFEVDFLHAGFIYTTPIQVFEVADGSARPIVYRDAVFDFGPSEGLREGQITGGFSGFRIWAPLGGGAGLEELVVFQGASYFRSRGKAQIYGASARGLAVDTAETSGEEFPLFRSFWIERPARGATNLVVHALLDSPRVTGAYTFEVMPGHETLIKVSAQIFTRKRIDVTGLAPLTSMFLFSPLNQYRFDDFRNAVHDSDGLLIWRGNGEWLWRALANPQQLQVSMFLDKNPKGFGLMQRNIDFDDYQDLQARYDKRPSLWVQPNENWGDGSVELVEIPTNGEYHDNIVAFWRPGEPIPARQSRTFSYLLRFGPSAGDPKLARVSATRSGLSLTNRKRLFLVDFSRPADKPLGDAVRVEASASRGAIGNLVGQPNEVTGGYRVSFEFEPGLSNLAELSVQLRQGEIPISEKWMFRWTGDP